MLKWPRLSVEYLTVKINSVISFIDYTPSLLKLVLFCCLCDRTKKAYSISCSGQEW